ncbi:hypothetical protein [Mucilaginibacter sp.]|uniref:hypothetical protein n=1 Tax=Mucilaginibacter sp. TaxID=1882438 RepID=UPI0025FDE0FF|nr:hypothetical protein [Mucilaginibacter sp.]
MIGVSTSPFYLFLTRKVNTWYSVKDGNWTDPNVWISNAQGKRNITSPRAGDNVFINHQVTVNVTTAVNNLFIAGTLKFDPNGNILTVTGDLQATGTIDQSAGNNNAIVVKGFNNFITTFIPGAASAIEYNSGLMTQSIMPLTYCNLQISGGTAVTKYLTSNLTIGGNFYCGSVLDTKNFNLSVDGFTTTGPLISSGNSGIIISSGNILFNGAIIDGGGKSLSVIGTASVEMRGGCFGAGFDLAHCDVNFTATQTLNDGFNFVCHNITMAGSVVVTNMSDSVVTVKGVMNGTVSSSTFNNNGQLIFNDPTLPMATGVFNHRNMPNSTVGYIFNGNYTLPYTLYENLQLGGTGIKNTSENTTINFNLFLGTTLELGNYDLTISGTTSGGNSAFITKSGAGNLLFAGKVDIGGITFLSSPTVEFRNGWQTFGDFIFATATINYTTNNQTIANGFSVTTFNCVSVIANGITVSCDSRFGNAFLFNSVLDGSNSTSTFNNIGTVNYKNAQQPMQTGRLYCNQSINTFTYGALGDQDITVPSDATPGYKNLILNGSGVKRLLGNISVKGTYTLVSPATLNSNGFALTNP